jgi:DNA polymerase
MKKLFLDFETRSALDIKKVGAWRYAMDPSTEIMCVSYCWAPHKAPLLLTSEEVARGMVIALDADTQLIAHNAHFEYAVWNFILHKRHGWPALWEPKHWGCTLSRAAMCNLPISLAGACKALQVPVQKDLAGRAAMLKLSRPIEIDPLGFPVYREDEALKQTMYEYCKKDVEAEMELDKRLPELPPIERKIWELDLEVNRRGVKADLKVAKASMGMAAKFTDSLNAQLSTLTGGKVSKASRVAEMKRWITSQGVAVDSLDKAAVVSMLADKATPPLVKEVVKIRQQVGKSSTAKYEAMTLTAGLADAKMRGLLQYHAAGTGRWGGRLVQPQNFPKGIGYKAPEVAEDILLGEDRFVKKYGDKTMEALSAGLRGAMTASPGKVLVTADYAAIEARVLLWLADDPFALAKFKMGMNLYVDMARFIYNNDSIVKPSETDATYAKEYALGKAAILGAGFGMGAPRFMDTCAQQYGIEISEDMAKTAIQAYRKKYKKVVEMWYAQEAAAIHAVRTPGSTHPCGKVVWGMDPKREFLVCKLPAGRHLRYYKPHLKAVETPRGEKTELRFWGEVDAQGKGVIEVDPVTGLALYKTYGGSLVENITQGVARDIMANGMFNAEAAGFSVVLTVHDELVAEIDPKQFEHVVPERHLEKTICGLPPWAAGCPIAAEGWSGFRYRK